jgi:hypothetical protein
MGMSADARRGLSKWHLPADALGQLGRVAVAVRPRPVSFLPAALDGGRFHMRKGEAFRVMSKHRLKGDHRLMSAPQLMTPGNWVHAPTTVRHSFSKV